MKQKHVRTGVVLFGIICFVMYGLFIQNRNITPEQAHTIAANKVNPPPQAELLGIKTINTTTNQNYLISWKITHKALDPPEGMLIEVQVTKQGEILNVLHYPLVETEYMANISKILAYQIAEDKLKTTLSINNIYSTGNPTIQYTGKTWEITWRKTIQDYIAPESTFRVKIDANSAKVTLIDNKLNTTPNINPTRETKTTRTTAIQLSEKHIKNQLITEYNAQNPQTRGPTKTEKIIIEHPHGTNQYIPCWAVITQMDCIIDGKITTVGATVTINIQTGEIIRAIIV